MVPPTGHDHLVDATVASGALQYIPGSRRWYIPGSRRWGRLAHNTVARRLIRGRDRGGVPLIVGRAFPALSRVAVTAYPGTVSANPS